MVGFWTEPRKPLHTSIGAKAQCFRSWFAHAPSDNLLSGFFFLIFRFDIFQVCSKTCTHTQWWYPLHGHPLFSALQQLKAPART
jgi:hypothetical protein